MPEYKMPSGYLSKSGGGSGNPETFERYVIGQWKSATGKAERQKIIDKAYENQKMSTYEYIIACLTLERKK